MCETRICKCCQKELPVTEFKVRPRKWYNKAGEEKIHYYNLKICNKCGNRLQAQRQRKRRQDGISEQPKNEMEFFNHEGVKCSITRVEHNTYRIITKDIELHYTHYVGLSGDLKVNTHFHYKNASEFINKTYEHRMLLFKEVCKLQNKINTDAAVEELRMFHSV